MALFIILQQDAFEVKWVHLCFLKHIQSYNCDLLRMFNISAVTVIFQLLNPEHLNDLTLIAASLRALCKKLSLTVVGYYVMGVRTLLSRCYNEVL